MIRLPSPAMCVALLALTVALGSAGYSATGGSFLLGLSNSATTTTTLAAPVAGPALRVTNTSTATGSTGITITTGTSRPPLAINSSVKVVRLNADLLDGLDSTAFARSTSEGWHYVGDAGEPPFLNGWVNYQTAATHKQTVAPNASYRLDANGVVHVRGLIKSNTGRDKQFSPSRRAIARTSGRSFR